MIAVFAGGAGCERGMGDEPSCDATTRTAQTADLLAPFSGGDVVDFSAFVGPKWETYYRKRFVRVAAGEDGGFNFAAGIAQAYWLIYRRMWLHAVILTTLNRIPDFLVARFVPAGEQSLRNLILIPAWAGWVVLVGTQSNAWYLRHVKLQVARARAEGLAGDALSAAMARRGRPEIWRPVLFFAFMAAHYALTR